MRREGRFAGTDQAVMATTCVEHLSLCCMVIICIIIMIYHHHYHHHHCHGNNLCQADQPLLYGHNISFGEVCVFGIIMKITSFLVIVMVMIS